MQPRNSVTPIRTRHRPPRPDTAILQTRIERYQAALREVTLSVSLSDAQTVADDSLTSTL